MCVTINGLCMTLTFDLGGRGACGWCGSSSCICIPSLKFVSLAIRKIWRTMFVTKFLPFSVNEDEYNEPDDLDLWPFYLETGIRVASDVCNLQSEFGHARLSGSRVIHYVRDGQTKTTLTAPLSTGGGIINWTDYSDRESVAVMIRWVISLLSYCCPCTGDKCK